MRTGEGVNERAREIVDKVYRNNTWPPQAPPRAGPATTTGEVNRLQPRNRKETTDIVVIDTLRSPPGVGGVWRVEG